MQKAMRVNNSQTENPCWRHCASKRDETCHINCNAYTEWVLEQERRKKKYMFRATMLMLIKRKERNIV